MNNAIVIYGSGPLARLMAYYFSHDSHYNVVCFTVDEEYYAVKTFCSLPVIPFNEVCDKFPPTDYKMLVAIGYKSMRNRKRMYDKAKEKNYALVNYISSKAITYDTINIGENNIIMGNVNIEPFVTIGNNNLFWSDTLVSHDVVIGDHNYISAKCLIGGGSLMENLCFFGNSTTGINDLIIRNETQSIPGSTLMESTKQCTKYIGTPARAIGTHHEEGIRIERG